MRLVQITDGMERRVAVVEEPHLLLSHTRPQRPLFSCTPRSPFPNHAVAVRCALSFEQVLVWWSASTAGTLEPPVSPLALPGSHLW